MSIKVRCMDWTECLCGHARPWRRGQVARMKKSGGDFIVYKRVSLSRGPQASFLYGTGLGVGINAGFHGGETGGSVITRTNHLFHDRWPVLQPCLGFLCRRRRHFRYKTASVSGRRL